MTEKKARLRQKPSTTGADLSEDLVDQEIFPEMLVTFCRSVLDARSKFARLRTENQALRAQVIAGNQALLESQQDASNLAAQCESLRQSIALAQDELDRSRAETLMSIFRDMASPKHGVLLRRLLAFDGDEPSLLREVAQYFRSQLNLKLQNEMGTQVTLTEENMDDYDWRETVSLPHKARVIGRGISFEGRAVLRTEVEPVEEAE